MNYSLYKNRLEEYLRAKNVEEAQSTSDGFYVRCFSPTHSDSGNPSCLVQNGNHFHCFGCGIDGDIYDAVGILEGIAERKDQYLFVENFFGGKPVSPIAQKPTIRKEKPYTENAEAMVAFRRYIENHPARASETRKYLKQHAIASSKKKTADYPSEIAVEMLKEIFYWPGYSIALNELGSKTLFGANIPGINQKTNSSTWTHSGVVTKQGRGYKLRFYDDKGSQKIGTKGCKSFPGPCAIDKNQKEIVFVEGEIDAIACRAAGLKNVYSTGSCSSPSKQQIEDLVKSGKVFEKIIIFFDNDEAGLKAAGYTPPASKREQNLPEKLKLAGYQGEIFIADIPAISPYKDPDEAIINGKLDLVKKAIENAKPYEKKEVTAYISSQKQPMKINADMCGNFGIKKLKDYLEKIPLSDFDSDQRQEFINALYFSSNDRPAIRALFGELEITQNEIDAIVPTDPYLLFEIAQRKNLSKYYLDDILSLALTRDHIKAAITFETPLVKITDALFNSILETQTLKKNLLDFIQKRMEIAASNVLSYVFKDKIIYIEATKEFYFFDGLIWNHLSAVAEAAFNVLSAILQKYAARKDTSKNLFGEIEKTRSKLQKYDYLTTVMKALAEKEGIFHKQITFDGYQIQETLTLQDCVLDFSGKKVVTRNARPEEFRQKKLPYFKKDVMSDKKPTEFIKFMNSNFENKDTLKTLMYYLSLLPSRRAQFKVGGIFVGPPHTGKTTTMEILRNIYPDMTVPIPRSMIMQSKYELSSQGPSPFMSRLEGMGAAISDETKRNDVLNGALWKQLTGGGMLTARGMWSLPRDFMPTAQIIILTNYSPKFDGKDTATIDRMVVVPFRVQHIRGEKGQIEEDELLDKMRPEFPLVVKLFAEYYINLRTKLKNKIPLSDECAAYKDDYVQNQETDLDRFVNENIEFVKDEKCFVPLKDVYARFCQFNDIELDEKGKPTDPEALTQSKFTRYMKSDYNEIRIKQMRIGGGNGQNGYPTQVILNIKLKPLETQPAQPAMLLGMESFTQPPIQKDYFPEENPFE